MATIPVDEGILAGRSVDFHVCNIDGDETLGLIGLPWLKANRVVIDYEHDTLRYKDDPSKTWHQMRTTGKGHMLMPLTRAAAERLETQACVADARATDEPDDAFVTKSNPNKSRGVILAGDKNKERFGRRIRTQRKEER